MPRCVNNANRRLLDDTSYCKQLIATNTEVLRWSERLSRCPDMALHAVGCDRSALRHASPRLRRDDAFLAGVVRRYPDAMQFVEVVGPRVLWARWSGWVTAVVVAAVGCVVAAAWAGVCSSPSACPQPCGWEGQGCDPHAVVPSSGEGVRPVSCALPS